MAAACLAAGLMVSPWASTAHAGGNFKDWEAELEPPGSKIEGDPAAESATGGCFYDSKPIDCTLGDAWWDGHCYVSVYSSDPSDPEAAAFWKNAGKQTGVLVACKYWPNGSEVFGYTPSSVYWVESASQPPSPQEYSDAAHLLVKGTVTAPDIGVFPGGLADSHPKASGLVGVPTWFWAENPGPGVGSEVTKSTKVNGHELEATVSFMETVYDTGDGNTVTCGLGSVPVNVHRPQESYTGCDHTYMERGTYTITATTYVEVNWTGEGRSGRLELSVERTGEYRVGENQVVIVP
jgi:hypothetical protein